MADDLAAVLADDAVVRVGAADFVVIEPGGKDLESPQLAAVFVQKDVVGIVRPRAVIPEWSEGTAGDVPAGQDPIRAVRAAGGALEDLVEILLRETS